MRCNGSRINIFISSYLCIIFVQYVTAQRKKISAEENNELDGNGNLYEIFKKRLDQINQELTYDIAKPFGRPKPTIKMGIKRFTAAEKNYDMTERRLKDRFNEVAFNDLMSDYSGAEKRSTVRESLYEEYKKRLDKINNEFSLDGEKVFDRSGRSFLQNEETHAKVQENNVYDESHKQVGKISNELHKNKKRAKKRYSRGLVHVVDGDFIQTHDFSKLRNNRNRIDATVDLNITDNGSGNNDNVRVLDINDKTQIVDDSLQIDYPDDYLNIIASAMCRRNVKQKKKKKDRAINLGNEGSSYPTVLTKAFEASLNPLASIRPGTLLETVAKKMNTTPLALAQKLTTTKDLSMAAMKNDSKLNQMLDKYIENTVMSTTDRLPKKTEAPITAQQEGVDNYEPMVQQYDSCTPDGDSTSVVQSIPNLSTVLNKVLSKLERIQQDKACTENEPPEGAPCDVVGSWTSHELGLRFEISVGKAAARDLAPCEKNNKLLSIDVQECNPPKHHEIIDIDWEFMGSALRQLGGPFYMYSQKDDDNLMATFAGFCRTCGSIDTIFGVWTFLFPSKDCQDISSSIENKRDILRRYNLETKRREHYKDLLYKKSKLSKSRSSSKILPK